MKKFIFAVALSFAASLSAQAASVIYTFEDDDMDNVFNVLFEIDNSTGTPSTGLSTYNVALSGLDAAGLDPSTFAWTQNNLENFNAAFMPQGIQAANLLQGAVGTDAFSAANGQFNSGTAVFGIGLEEINIGNNPGIPIDADIELGVPALLGSLSITGADSLTNEELLPLFAPNAALFQGQDSSAAFNPDGISVVLSRGGSVNPNSPEPTTAMLVALGLAGFASRRRV